MKRMTVFAMIAAASLLLSACDQILEGFYPEFKQSYEERGEGLKVRVSVDSGLYYDSSRLGTRPIRVKLVPYYETAGNYYIDTSTIREKTISRSDLSVADGYSKILGFADLYDALWAAYVYIDANNDSQIDYSEISIQATDESGNNMADYRYGAFPLTMNGNLQSYSKIEGWILDQIKGGAPGGTNQAPSAFIGNAPASVNQNTSAAFDAWGSWDPDGYLVEWRWIIYKDGIQQVEIVKDNEHLDYAFPNTGNYQVTLSVRDNAGATSTTVSTWVEVTTAGAASKNVRILGSVPAGYEGQTTRFVLIRAWDYEWVTRIDTMGSSYDNSFFDVIDDTYIVLGWVDSNQDWKVDAGEPGRAAIVQGGARTSLVYNGVVPNVYSFDFTNGDNVEVRLDIAAGDQVWTNLAAGGSEPEAASGAFYDLTFDITNTAYAGWTVYFGRMMSDGNFVWGPTYETLAGGNMTYTATAMQYTPSPNPDYAVAYIDLDVSGGGPTTGDLFVQIPIWLADGKTAVTATIGDADWVNTWP